ncbi:MAG: sugar ABC transporter permease [Chloroflexi bacterium]|nr:sugar ABC transporter permease [Chloroflexota bacterium]MCY4246316.1 sugar ABC transporter permease [Chloroflexota bacterium]
MFRRFLRPISPSARREERIFYLFILPWVIGLVVFNAGPVLGMLGLSFTDWRISLDNLSFIGLENYAKLFDDPVFWVSVGNTLYIVVGRVVFGTAFALLLAILLNQKVPGIPFFRAVYYLPTVTAGVAVALVWIWIFNPRLGILNYFLKQIGIQGPPWIYSSTWVKPSLILMSLFQVGPNMIILLAGLQGVPKELYESAEIDGAGNWAKFRNVTLPMLSPVLFFVIIISVVGSFQNFTEIRVMTQGGPGESSNVLIWYLWENSFVFLQLGVAAAVAWIMFVILMALTGLQFRLGRRWVFYEV